ncbi:trans-sulfuration enzyme family protein [Paenibacillus abyssi]|uniref:homocysteine desulfhydrase n=1 Tax=Paenibacillus abyssi TaxID=1340531 RepID=A0A917G0G9_9BACL|nr:aminotransferase class I/II-fold pyridoxal phosphate-dependent enzyme [Paenibacillus abyssi]GGG16540.1 cystathionine gamma-synthase [Paenibacillus abyssi]
MSDRSLNKQTLVVHDVHNEQYHGAVTMPIYQNSLFTFHSYDAFTTAMNDPLNHHLYSRGNNPTVNDLERRLALLEGGEQARCFASGMAAISAAVLSVIKSGDHIICIDQAYGPTKELIGSYLRKFDIEATFVDGSSMDNIQQAVRDNTSLIFLESPTTLHFQLQNLSACAELAKSIGAATIIDNTWATPCYQNPLSLGIDLVIHSLTKYVSGHSDGMGGVVIGSSERMKHLGMHEFLLHGGIMSPMTAASMIKGLRTLPLRMEKFQENGLIVAGWLEKHPLVAKVNHPGLSSHPQHHLALKQMSGSSSLFSFETNIPLLQMRCWAERLTFFRIGLSWGGYESLITVHPCQRESSSVVRIYVGLEDPYELIDDLAQAFECITEFEGVRR